MITVKTWMNIKKILSLEPDFAIIFMSFRETNLMSEWPSSFKLVFYKRYIDDSLLNKSQSNLICVIHLVLITFLGQHIQGA